MMKKQKNNIRSSVRPLNELAMQKALAAGYRQAMNRSARDRAAAPLLRTEIGDVLREIRRKQGRTLREVSSEAQVSLGYLSEVERGQKEASSELLDAISEALGVPLWYILREVSERMAVLDRTVVPDTVPENLVPVTLIS